MLCICALKVTEFNQRVATLNQNLRVGLPKIPPIPSALPGLMPSITAAAAATESDV